MFSPIACRCLLLSLAVAAGLLAPPVAGAAGKNVKVHVVTILATSRDNKVDPKLKCIADEVRKKEPALTGFHLKGVNCLSLTPNRKTTVPLIDGQELIVVIHHGADERNRVELMVKAPSQGKIVYRSACGKFLPIVTRYKTRENGDRLILAIMVQPCHQK